jgi:anti-sigma regulatory factor (Ser/Thr protein kinase)
VRRTTPLPTDAAAASFARTFVRVVLGAWGLDRLEPDASLLATELVTNGLRYGGGPRSLTLVARGGRLRIAVADHEPVRRPRRRPASLTAEGGRGLALVEAMATTWGTHRSRLHRGKVVWCELPLGRGGPRRGVAVPS